MIKKSFLGNLFSYNVLKYSNPNGLPGFTNKLYSDFRFLASKDQAHNELKWKFDKDYLEYEKKLGIVYRVEYDTDGIPIVGTATKPQVCEVDADANIRILYGVCNLDKKNKLEKYVAQAIYRVVVEGLEPKNEGKVWAYIPKFADPEHKKPYHIIEILDKAVAANKLEKVDGGEFTSALEIENFDIDNHFYYVAESPKIKQYTKVVK